MVDQKLTDYIRQQLQLGRLHEQITKSLLDAGWPEGEIQTAFQLIDAQNQTPAAIQNSTVASSNSLPSVDSLIKESWLVFSKQIKTLLGIILLPVLAAIPIVILYFIGAGFGVALLVKDISVVKIVSVIVVSILLGLITVYIYAWSQAALIFTLDSSPEQIGIRESYRRGRKKIGALFSTYSWSGLVILGAVFLLVVPAIFLAVSFFTASYIAVLEDQKGINALLKSRQYIKGRWWAVFGRLIFVNLVYMLIFFAVKLLLSGILSPFKLASLANLLSSVLSFLSRLFLVVFNFVLYRHLKGIKGEFVFSPSKKSKIGLVLISLLSLLSILAPLILVAINPVGQLSQARDSQRMADQVLISGALEQYFVKNNVYPESLNQLVPQYLETLPDDPKPGKSYDYLQLSKNDYQLCFEFETKGRQCSNSSGEEQKIPKLIF
ncbi:MAG TPA: hypothetical protein VMW41_01730 [Candidatus Bathyarchaeia archaeon]|nr:hypothetical protein [Candidatus Bathyarchaeia archaeon]